MVAHTTQHTFLIGRFAKSDSFHCSRCILRYLNQYPYLCNNIFEPHTLLTHTYSVSISQFLCESLGICYQRYSTTRKNSCKTISRSSVGHEIFQSISTLSLQNYHHIHTSIYTSEATPSFFHGRPWTGDIPHKAKERVHMGPEKEPICLVSVNS